MILSTEAQRLLSHIQSTTKEGVISVVEDLHHDGYDAEGPESDLWDFYVIFKDDAKEYRVDVYHREDWFTGKIESYERIRENVPLNVVLGGGWIHERLRQRIQNTIVNLKGINLCTKEYGK